MESYIQKLINEKADIADFIHIWEMQSISPVGREMLEHYFKMYILKNTAFSIEYFFKNVKLKSHPSIGLSFVPTSKSYNELGKDVCIVDFICSDKDGEYYWNNLQNNNLTYGTFKALKLPDPDKEPYGKEIEISTYDIYEILHL